MAYLNLEPFLPPIEHKAWARAVKRGGFYSGNAATYSQLSTHVRAFTETRCNGFDREPGDLQRYDLNSWRAGVMPQHVASEVRRLLRNQSGWLYCIVHWTGKHRTIHGWILMDHRQNECLFRTYPASRKSESCMAYALRLIELDAIRYNCIRANHCFEATLDRLHPTIN
jgi:hypothetical protein